jgi:hypothetical protein
MHKFQKNDTYLIWGDSGSVDIKVFNKISFHFKLFFNVSYFPYFSESDGLVFALVFSPTCSVCRHLKI